MFLPTSIHKEAIMLYLYGTRLREDLGQPHWYSEVFRSDDVQAFLNHVLLANSTFVGVQFPSWQSDRIILTVAHPEESGALYGFKVVEMIVPGR